MNLAQHARQAVARAFLAVVAVAVLLTVAVRSDAVVVSTSGPAKAPSATVVFQPGGPGGSGVYTTWAATYAAASKLRAFAPTIVFDGTFALPTIPAGTWELGGFTLLTPSFVNFQVNVADGAALTLTGSSLYLNGITLQWQSTSAPAMTIAGGNNSGLFLTNGALITADPAATKPFCALTGGSLVVIGSAQAAIGGIAAAPVFNNTGAGLTVFFNTGPTLGAGSAVGAFSFAGGGTTTVTLDPSVTISATQTATGLTVSSPGASLLHHALTLSSAGGAQGLPTRPTTATAPAPSNFLARPSGNQSSATTYTLQVASAYQPNDVVRVLFTVTQLNSVNVTVVDAGSGGTLGVLVASKTTTTTGSAWLDAQLNAAGTNWSLLGGGYL